jgi:hypothetical protein
MLLLAIQIIVGCKMLKNGLGEPQSTQQQIIPYVYDSAVIKTGWNKPYQVLTPWEKTFYSDIVQAKPDTHQQLPANLRTYTIPVPTKK